jgi:CheY-like chemotaxis protein
MLEELGLGVVEAPHGEAALAVLTSEREADIHVILLDLRMPVMNGWDFLELLPKYARLSAIPIVVVSAAAHAGEASEHPSVVAWFRAPYAMSQLREVVSSLAPS